MIVCRVSSMPPGAYRPTSVLCRLAQVSSMPVSRTLVGDYTIGLCGSGPLRYADNVAHWPTLAMGDFPHNEQPCPERKPRLATMRCIQGSKRFLATTLSCPLCPEVRQAITMFNCVHHAKQRSTAWTSVQHWVSLRKQQPIPTVT